MRTGTFIATLIILLGFSFTVGAVPDEIEVGAFIDRVIAGEDFADTEITVTGIALNQTTSQDHLVNIGTKETYQSGAYLNFVSVYDTSVTIEKGSHVTLRVSVETASAHNLGDQWAVLIETAFLECLSC